MLDIRIPHVSNTARITNFHVFKEKLECPLHKCNYFLEHSIYHYWWSLFTARKRSLGQGNIFIGMCQSFCPWGAGLCMMLLLSGRLVPLFFWKGGSLCPIPCPVWGVSVSGPMFFPRGLPLGSICPGDLCPETVPDRDPNTETPWTETPMDRRGLCPGRASVRETPGQKPPYSEERAVHILLECFLFFTFDLFGPILGGCLNIKLVR